MRIRLVPKLQVTTRAAQEIVQLFFKCTFSRLQISWSSYVLLRHMVGQFSNWLRSDKFTSIVEGAFIKLEFFELEFSLTV